MTDIRTMRPEAVSTPAELIRQMHRLKDQSGMTYRQIAARARDAGDFLPSSTLAGALSRHTLPSEELLAAFVRACTGDEQTVRSWLLARNAVAALAHHPAPHRAPTPEPADQPTAPWHQWRRPALVLAFLATACGTAAWQLAARGNPDQVSRRAVRRLSAASSRVARGQ
ncbi:hypothetical protein [Streptomyces mayteni]